MKKIIIFLLLIMNTLLGFNQTMLKGKVIDFITKEPLPFVKVSILKTPRAKLTDFDGDFAIKYARKNIDSISFEYVGYFKQTIALNSLPKLDSILIELKSNTTLEVIEVVSGKNPAFKVLKAINDHRKENNPSKLGAYQYEVYDKIQFDMNNIDKEFQDKKYLQKFKFIGDYVDTTNGKRTLPVLLTEQIADVYHKSGPTQHIEIVKATHLIGINNLDLTQFTRDLNKEINLYDGYYEMFSKDFLSPISPLGRGFYDYRKIDDDTLGGVICKHLTFLPKRRGTALYEGEIWVTEDNYAIKKVNLKIPNDINLNYVSNMSIQQEYTLIDSAIWMIDKYKIQAEFRLLNEDTKKKSLSVFIRKNSSKTNVIINQPKPFDFYTGTIILTDGADERTSDYWLKIRHDTLNTQEAGVVKMIDSLESNKTFKFYDKMIRFGLSGYWPIGKVEFGYLYSLYNRNEIEGHRVMLKLRTSQKLNKKHRFQAFGSYGFLDKRFKFGGSYEWQIKNEPFEQFKLSYARRVEQLSLAYRMGDVDNSFTTIFSLEKQNKMTMTDKVIMSYEKDYLSPFRSLTSIEWKNFIPVGAMRYDHVKKNGDTVAVKNLKSFEIKNTITFTKKEKFIKINSRRLSMGSSVPIISLTHTMGIKGIAGSKYNYQRFDALWRHRPKVGMFGKMRYEIYSGVVFGRVPFPLQNVHAGNETFYMQIRTFNLMKYYEFVSDIWTGFNFQHQLQGLILDRIPLIRKLKWRAVYGLKAVTGFYSPSNDKDIILPSYSRTFNNFKPYAEATIGIENIFKFLRIDGIYRLTYNDLPDASRFGIQFRFIGDF